MSPNEILRPRNLPEDAHRPTGRPMTREARSQKAQLQSVHKHGTRKDVKMPMDEKTGRE